MNKVYVLLVKYLNTNEVNTNEVFTTYLQAIQAIKYKTATDLVEWQNNFTCKDLYQDIIYEVKEAYLK